LIDLAASLSPVASHDGDDFASDEQGAEGFGDAVVVEPSSQRDPYRFRIVSPGFFVLVEDDVVEGAITRTEIGEVESRKKFFRGVESGSVNRERKIVDTTNEEGSIVYGLAQDRRGELATQKETGTEILAFHEFAQSPKVDVAIGGGTKIGTLKEGSGLL